MSNTAFYARHGVLTPALITVGNSTVNTVTNSSSITIGANVIMNTSSISVGNSTVNTTINSTTFTSSSNTFTIGTAAYHVSNGNFGVGNSTPTDKLSINGTTYHQGNVILGNSSITVGLQANGSYGTAGQVLTSNGAATYWAAGGFASGTMLVFAQTAAPTGWTKSTTHNDKALRIVSGTASSGGSVAFSTAFASQAVSGTVGSTTISTTTMPSHNHSVSAGNVDYATVAYAITPTSDASTSIGSGSSGGGGSHNHTFSGTAINLAVNYVDAILASKD